ncbi:hypothetical protein O9992_28760 [Vibrio lentus]|nr:hypothetical protein [Vibrio lentus]
MPADQRYIDTINTLLDGDEADAILIMHSPSAIAHSGPNGRANYWKRLRSNLVISDSIS